MKNFSFAYALGIVILSLSLFVFQPMLAGYTAFSAANRSGFQPVSSNKSDGKAKVDLAGDNVWTSNGPYGGSIGALAVDPLNPSVIYAGTYDGLAGTGDGVYKSTDGGASWTPMNQGLPANTHVLALALNPANPDVLYAGVHNGGVYKSTNGGASWTQMNQGLTNTRVYALAVSPSGQVVHAGTRGGGVFSYSYSSSGVCTLACNAIVPSTATINTQVQFTATTTLANCTGAPTYEWNFGDGTPNSTQQNPQHIYTKAGSFNWLLTVRGPNGTSCSKSGTVKVSPATVAKADLALTIPQSANPAYVGGGLLYTFSIANRGPDSATAVMLSIGNLPSSFAVDRVTASQGSCSNWTCAIGSLNNGATATVTLVVVPMQQGDFSITANVSGNETDPVAENNRGTINSRIIPLKTQNSTVRLIGEINKNLDTIVLTHGLQPKSDMAGAPDSLWIGNQSKAGSRGAGFLIGERLVNSVNILQFVWDDAFQVSTPIRPYRDEYVEAKVQVINAGRLLAKNLLERLGGSYNKKIHFVGHSLGTVVNAYAITTFLNSAPLVSQAQFTALDRPHHINTIIRGVIDAYAGDDFEIIYGYDADFFAQQFKQLARSPNPRLVVDNYFSLTGAGVGDRANPVDGVAFYNHDELKNPNDVGGKFFEDEDLVGFDNNHSGVHQWYRLTINPSRFSTSICTGAIFDKPLGWDNSLNPCQKGWYWSLFGDSPLSFPPDKLSQSLARSVQVDLNYSNFKNIHGCQAQGSVICREASSAFAVADILVPSNANYFSFDYKFSNVGDGDYAAILIDNTPVWVLDGAAFIGSDFVNTGPIPIRGLRGNRKISFALYGVGQVNAVVEFSNFKAIAVSNPPILNLVSDQSVLLGNSLSFKVAASDPDGDSLTFSLPGAPAGASINPSTGDFSWTPSVTQIGSFSFKIRVTDNSPDKLFAEQIITVTVTNPNPVPTINAVPVSRQQGSPASNATIANVSDANQAAGTLTVKVNDNTNATVNGVTVSSLSVSAAGVVTASVVTARTAANASFTLTVTDSAGASANATLNVTVTSNTAPTLTYGNQSVAAGGSLTINPAAGPSDNGTLSSIVVQSQGSYAGTISVNNSTGIISLSGAKPDGQYTITIRATDNCGAVTNATFTLTVTCPTITVNPATLPNGTIGTAYNQTVSATGSTAPYSFMISAGALPNGLSLNPSSGAITGTPTTAAPFNFTIKATDTNGCPGMQQYTVNVSQPTVVNVSAASYSDAQLAPEAIVAAFGNELAAGTVAASTLPLPTTLNGTTVKIRDSAGAERLAGLFFVAPAQINYQIPQGTAAGVATVTVTSGSGALSVGTMQIATVAPGLFAANANGQGVAAAVALRVKASGAQTYEPIARFDTTINRMVATPIDLGPTGEQVFLILYGTGFRYRSALSAATAKIGGVDAQVLFAGAQGSLVGLDQVNALIPRSLIGRGEVDVVLTIDGQATNTVRINVR